MVRRVSAREAFGLMGEGYAYVDVRSEVEFALGHPVGAWNVVFPSDSFVEAVRARFAPEAKLIVGCASGVRSLAAAQVLLEAGFHDVFEQRAGMMGVRDAFGRVKERGWRDEGLPTASEP